MGAYTRDQYHEMAKVLRKSKKFLWDGKQPQLGHERRHICYALSLASKTAYTSAPVGRIIACRLAPSATLSDWLKRHISAADRNSLTEEQVQAHRHAWVDVLIAEFEAAANKKAPGVASIAPKIVAVSPVGQKVKTVWL